MNHDLLQICKLLKTFHHAFLRVRGSLLDGVDLIIYVQLSQVNQAQSCLCLCVGNEDLGSKLVQGNYKRKFVIVLTVKELYVTTFFIRLNCFPNNLVEILSKLEFF